MGNLMEAVEKYFKRFKRSYPMYWLNGLSEDEQIAEIEKALKAGKPIEPKWEQDKVY